MNLNALRRESKAEIIFKRGKRPSTKEAIDRNNSINKTTDLISKENKFNTSCATRTPGQHSEKTQENDSDQAYGLSKTNESFQKGKWMSGSKTQNSTVGFSASTGNTTDYGKGFGETQLRNLKNLPS